MKYGIKCVRTSPSTYGHTHWSKTSRGFETWCTRNSEIIKHDTLNAAFMDKQFIWKNTSDTRYYVEEMENS